MVKDSLVGLKNKLPKVSNIKKITKERQQHDKQLSLSLNRNTPVENLTADEILTKLQKKFSGNKQEITDFIDSQVKFYTKDLYRKANFDVLTHLPNRSYFQEVIQQILMDAEGIDSSFTLLFLDLDGFKKVNDQFGHPVGDELLKHASARLIASLREDDIVARLGGDEFVVLLIDSNDGRKTIEEVSKRIITNISLPYFLDNNEVKVSTSIGISIFPEDGSTISELMKNADTALYMAKHKGKKQFRFYADIPINKTTDIQTILTELTQAIETNKIFSCVQPQINLADNKIVGAYIQPHWQTESFKSSSWSNWQDILKESKYEKTVNSWLFDTACHYLKQWQKLNSAFIITIPILDILKTQKNITEYLTQRIVEFEVSKKQIQLSVSLSELNIELTNKLISLIADDFQISITDLGSEKLDLDLLVNLKIKQFCFNGQWLKQQMLSNNGQLWVKALTQMVKSLGAKSMALNINNKEELEQIIACGIDLGQGNYWAEEIDSAEFKNHINKP